jgi:hypothetical protein
LIASGIAGKVLSHYGKSDLAETLHSITYLSAYGYGLYISYKVVSLAAKVFLGIFV